MSTAVSVSRGGAALLALCLALAPGCGKKPSVPAPPGGPPARPSVVASPPPTTSSGAITETPAPEPSTVQTPSPSPLTASAKPGAPAGAAAPAVAPVTVGSAGNEVASAKELVNKLTQTQSVNQMPPLLTNRTAAGMGMMISAFAYMAASMAEGMSGAMSSSAGAPPGAKPPAANPQAQAQIKKIRAAKASMDGLYKKYGIDPKKLTSPNDLSKNKMLMSSGRQFMTDTLTVLDQLRGGSPVKEKPQVTPPKDIRYKVLGPQKVAITGKDPNTGKDVTLYAVVEDGAWRLDVPFREMARGAAPPPGPPGGPGMGMPPGGPGMMPGPGGPPPGAGGPPPGPGGPPR